MSDFNPDSIDLSAMKAALERMAVRDGITPTAIPYLSLLRASHSNHLSMSMLRPSICMVIQGEKEILIDKQLTRYSAGSYVAAGITMLTSGHVVDASETTPYLGIHIDLEPQQIAALLLSMDIPSPKRKKSGPGAYVAQASPELLNALLRLVQLAYNPQDAMVLAPAVVREILYRVLTSEHGHLLHAMVATEGSGLGISRAIELLKNCYSQKLHVETLAKEAGMSVSGFHHKFKTITGLAPLQYQKRVRLLEARKMLLLGGIDAATASFAVGYESPSQFSREYRRQFGAPPLQDIACLKNDPLRNPRQN
jgi:AraC-like DNA-binding protein